MQVAAPPKEFKQHSMQSISQLDKDAQYYLPSETSIDLSMLTVSLSRADKVRENVVISIITKWWELIPFYLFQVEEEDTLWTGETLLQELASTMDMFELDSTWQPKRLMFYLFYPKTLRSAVSSDFSPVSCCTTSGSTSGADETSCSVSNNGLLTNGLLVLCCVPPDLICSGSEKISVRKEIDDSFWTLRYAMTSKKFELTFRWGWGSYRQWPRIALQTGIQFF